MPVSSFFITLLAIVGLVLVMLLAFTMQAMTPVYALIMLPVAVYFVNHPARWIALIVALHASTIILPGTPSNMTLYDLVGGLFVAFAVVYSLVARKGSEVGFGVRLGSLALAVVIAVTIAVRGVGIRFFGSETWGGAAYVTILMGIGLLNLIDRMEVSPALWRRAAIAMCILSLMPLFAQMLFIVSKGRVYHQYAFVRVYYGALTALDSMETGEGIERFQTGLSGLCVGFLPFLLFKRPFESAGRIAVSFSFWLGAAVMLGFSGFRSAIAYLVGFVALWIWLGDRKPRWFAPLLLVVATAAMLCLMALFASSLPKPVQRALTMFPFADVPVDIKLDAEISTTWRLEVWGDALKRLPDNLIVGEGFAFDPQRLYEAREFGDINREWAAIMRNYHNGPLSLTMILGVPGLVAGLFLLICGIKRYLSHYYLEWPDDTLFMVYRVFLAWFMTQFVLFLVAYGDAQFSLPAFLLQMSVMEGILATRRRLLSQIGSDANSATVVHETALPPSYV